MKAPLIALAFTLSIQAIHAAPGAGGADAAAKFLGLLDDAQKTKAALPFAHEERENFRYTPRGRAGLPLKEMNDAQKAAAMSLLDSALSEKGKLKATQIITLEGILAELEKNPTYRDDGKYFVGIFGTPGAKSGWGWRFEGHHLSINLTYSGDGVISATPSFMGSNPREVKEGRHKGLRVLAEEEDLARTLASTLMSGGKEKFIFSDKAPYEILTGEDRTAKALEPVGITAEEMTESQREALLSLISVYTGRYRSDVAASDMEKIKKAGIEKIRFGWAGGIKAGEAYYYRIQGPTFLMECANTQNNAQHIHASWRDFTGDFGRDALKEHYTEDH